MWISRKRFKALEKKIADLEVQVQGQQSLTINLEVDKTAEEISHLVAKRLTEQNIISFC